jgi:UDP-N-acetylglucosamine 4-epimerase
MLVAVKDNANIKRFVYAASSSTYGDSPNLPKVEGFEGNPLSPYAVTKLVNELYADVFSRVYNLHTIGLRYFNIFGPNQNPDNPYAAVIPIFCKAYINGEAPNINGDGITSRDFTFVENAIQANIKAMLFEDLEKHEVMNVACGDQISLNDMIELLKKISGKQINAIYLPERAGDVKHSKASIDKIKAVLNYHPEYRFQEGLEIVYEWYKTVYNNKP